MHILNIPDKPARYTGENTWSILVLGQSHGKQELLWKKRQWNPPKPGHSPIRKEGFYQGRNLFPGLKASNCIQWERSRVTPLQLLNLPCLFVFVQLRCLCAVCFERRLVRPYFLVHIYLLSAEIENANSTKKFLRTTSMDWWKRTWILAWSVTGLVWHRKAGNKSWIIKKKTSKNSQFNEFSSVIKFYWWTVLKSALKVFFRFCVKKIWISFFSVIVSW